jgi:fermentation-respiration switch protein FrsA (DUF1100 family)
MLPGTHAPVAADRRARARGEAPVVIPVVDADPTALSGLPTADSHAYFYGPAGAAERDKHWVNELTLRSVELMSGYEPGWYLPRISPTPLLMVGALDDSLAPAAWSLAAYESAPQPKKLVTLPGGHFGAYQGKGAEVAAAAARDWFAEHLLG